MDKLELELAGCLRRLFRNRYLLRSRNQRWFQSLIEHRARLQEILNTFGVFLELNEPLGIAYLKPLSDDMEEQLSIRLSRSQTLSAYASALLLHLRWQRLQFYLQPTGDDVPICGALDLREFLLPFSQAKIDNQFERQFRRGLEELLNLQVLVETGSDSGYYEITSLCDLLLPADRIHELRSRAEQYFNRAAPAEGEL